MKESFNLVGVGENLKAVFSEIPTASTSEFNVVFKDVSGKILQSTKVLKNGTLAPPKDPVLVGYRFISWDQDFSIVTKDMILKPIFERVEDTYTINVIGGRFKEGSTSGEFQFDMPVTVIVDSSPMGQKFSHWEIDGRKVSISNSYLFYAPKKDTTLTAIFVAEEEANIQNPFITLSDEVLVDTENHTMMFTANRTVPDGFTLVESGIMLLKSNTALQDELTLDTQNSIRGKIKNDSTDQFYIRKSNVVDGDTWYARAYLIYMDINNNIYVVYSSNTVSKRMGG